MVGHQGAGDVIVDCDERPRRHVRFEIGVESGVPSGRVRTPASYGCAGNPLRSMQLDWAEAGSGCRVLRGEMRLVEREVVAVPAVEPPTAYRTE